MNDANNSVTTFLNVDLDIRAREGLDELLELIEPFAFALNKTAQEATVELNEDLRSLDDCLMQFMKNIEALSHRGRALWDQCEYRRFNVGIQGGSEPHEAHFAVARDMIAQLANIGGELLVTIYAPSE